MKTEKKTKEKANEILRQTLHILLGVVYITIFYFLPKEQSSPLIALFLILGTIISLTHTHMKLFPFLKKILLLVERENEKHLPGKAAIDFTAGILLSIILFYPFSKTVSIAALIVLTFGDGFSTALGKKFGKIKTLGKRTLEGTLAGIIASAIALLPFLPIQTAIIASITGMLAEYLPLNDNYTIPIAAGIAILAFL